MPRDWHAPEVDHLIEAFQSGAGPAMLLEGLTALGMARGKAGVGIDEALADAACFAELAWPNLTFTKSEPEPSSTLFGQQSLAGEDSRSASPSSSDPGSDSVSGATPVVLANQSPPSDAVDSSPGGSHAGQDISDSLGSLAKAINPQITAWTCARAVASGWAEAAVEGVTTEAVLDPASGMGTPSYLTLRLEEEYLAAKAAGEDFALTHYLVLVDTDVVSAEPFEHLLRAASLGHVLRQVFDAGQPMARFRRQGALGVVLVKREGDQAIEIAKLKDRLIHHFGNLTGGSAVRMPPRVWAEPIASSYKMALSQLASFGR
ncbi:MAG: hypothetical protein FWD29_09630 [Micrococcales bacterium]|nr:hypothetical protein [Micrococcales bacterium]